MRRNYRTSNYVTLSLPAPIATLFGPKDTTPRISNLSLIHFTITRPNVTFGFTNRA